MSDSPTQRRRRIPAMAPEQRRAAIIAATVPLLRTHGPDLSTRQIACAAGVSEGTLFNVFADKDALVRAALVSVLDPEQQLAALRGIDPGLDLAARIRAAIAIVRPWLERNTALLAALRRPQTPARAIPDGDDHQFRDRIHTSRTQLRDALAALIEPDAAALRCSPGQAAHVLFLLIVGHARGFLGSRDTLTDSDLVSLILDGIRRGAHEQPAIGEPAAHNAPERGD